MKPWTALITLTLASLTQGVVVQRQSGSNPTVKNATLVGVVTDPTLNRDSCGSTKWGSRALWTCRDSNVLENGQPINFFSSSASYSNINTDNTIPLSPVPAGQPNGLNYTAAYLLYGDNKNVSFYTILPDECGDNEGGNCNNGTRYAIWPDSPPLVVSGSSDTITGYTWIKAYTIVGLVPVYPDPPGTLYKVSGSDDQTALPTVTVVQEDFYDSDHFVYGHYGGIVVDDTAYLYAQNSNLSVAVAKVPITSIEDKSQYQYYVNGAWTSTAPTVYDSTAYISATAGGQGTFYYNDLWSSYVWIGQLGGCACPNFYITTSPAPEGPWTSATKILDVPPGNYSGIGAYSMQAHPEFVPGPEQNAIYLSYVQQYTEHYETPLYLLYWN